MEHINFSKNTLFASIALKSQVTKSPYVKLMRMCYIG